MYSFCEDMIEMMKGNIQVLLLNENFCLNPPRPVYDMTREGQLFRLFTDYAIVNP